MPAAPVKRFYSIREVATTFSLTYNGIYNLVQQGEIPAVRVGKAIRIPGSWVAAAISVSGERDWKADPGQKEED
jgi:excisionase family DNA binding protein